MGLNLEKSANVVAVFSIQHSLVGDMRILDDFMQITPNFLLMAMLVL